MLPMCFCQRLGDNLSVEHRRAARDPVKGVKKLLHPGDPVLQQVADGAGTVREQIAGVGHLDVLAEDQHGGGRQMRAGGDRRAQALVGACSRRYELDISRGMRHAPVFRVWLATGLRVTITRATLLLAAGGRSRHQSRFGQSRSCGTSSVAPSTRSSPIGARR